MWVSTFYWSFWHSHGDSVSVQVLLFTSFVETVDLFRIMDVHSRKIVLLKALQGNSDPLVIGRLYADLVKSLSLVPRRLRFDKGTETVEMALIQATLLHEMGIDQTTLEGCIHGKVSA